MIHKIFGGTLALFVFIAAIATSIAITALVTDQYTSTLWTEYVQEERHKAYESGFENGFYMAGYEWCMFKIAGEGLYPWMYYHQGAQEHCLKLQQELFRRDAHELEPPPGWDMNIVKRGGRTG